MAENNVVATELDLTGDHSLSDSEPSSISTSTANSSSRKACIKTTRNV